MRISYKYSLTIFLFLVFLDVASQKSKSGFGYIITLQNDTIPCVFKPRKWQKQPFEVKVSIAGRDSILSPGKIKGFYVSGAGLEYKSMRISPALYEVNMQFAIGNDYKPFFDSSRFAFLRLAYKGRLSLYYYQDQIERHHFFIGTGDELTEVYKHLYSTAGGFHNTDPIVTWYNQYLYMLKIYLTECKSLYSIIDAMEINEKNLVALLHHYDNCKGTKNGE